MALLLEINTKNCFTRKKHKTGRGIKAGRSRDIFVLKLKNKRFNYSFDDLSIIFSLRLQIGKSYV